MRWGIALLFNLPLPFITLPIVGSDWISQEPGTAAGQSMGLAIVIGLTALIAGHVFKPTKRTGMATSSLPLATSRATPSSSLRSPPGHSRFSS